MTMTEKQKMLSNVYYNARDPELASDRRRCMLLLNQLNTSTDDSERETLSKQIFGAIGKGSGANPTFRCDYGYNIFMGDHVEINYDSCFLDIGKIILGNNVFMGPNIHIYTVNHPLDPVERRTGIEIGKDVKIGDDTWIGGCVVICPGVTIGRGVTIGAGSVVTKDIPDNCVAVGNPAKVVKTLAPIV